MFHIYENIHKCIHNAHGFSKHRRLSLLLKVASHPKPVSFWLNPRLYGQLLDGQFSTTGVLSGHMLESAGEFSKTLTPEPHPQMSQQLWAGCFNILEKKIPVVSLLCNHG